jgi:hypothetical protein
LLRNVTVTTVIIRIAVSDIFIAVSDIRVRNYSAADVCVRVFGNGDTDVPGRWHPDKDVRMSDFLGAFA